MKMNVEATIFKEMLATLDSSEDHWDMEKPQEAFLAKRGEVKYWLNDKECLNATLKTQASRSKVYSKVKNLKGPRPSNQNILCTTI